MKRWALWIAYDGSRFFGWQKQPNRPTIQGHLEEALSRILRQPISSYGAGRTDAGVHARMQVAHITAPDLPTDFIRRVNALLPPDIVVYHVAEVPETFHARHSALYRRYVYYLTFEKNPFLYKYAWHIPHIDKKFLDKASEIIQNQKNFKSFCKNATQYVHTICQVQYCHWKVYKHGLYFEIQANRFLQGMVRSLVGAMVRLAQRSLSWEKWERYINAEEQNTTLAPPQGLFLQAVGYPEPITMPEMPVSLPFEFFT